MRTVIRIFSIAAAAVAISSCNQVDFKKTKGGMPYKLFPGSGNEKVVEGGFIKVHLTYKKNDSVLQSTYTSMPTYLPVTKESQPYDISEIIPTLKKGDSVYVEQLVDTFMKRTPDRIPPSFKKGDKLITTIKVLEVYKTEQEAQQDFEKNQSTAMQGQIKKDDEVLKNYLAKNNIQAQKVGEGTYVQIITQGTGEPITDGKSVSLRYKGTTLDGKVFDTNMDNSFKHQEPLDFIVGAQPMIKGFDEGVKNLRQGTKARLYIPSALAYGQNAPPSIGPNANLIFDIEVLKVSNQAPPTNSPNSPIIDTVQPR